MKHSITLSTIHQRRKQRPRVDAVLAVKLYLEDESATATSVAKILGVDRHAVARAVKNAGHVLRVKTGNYRVDRDRVVSLYLESDDRSANEIAHMMGHSPSHIAAILRDRGVYDPMRVGARRVGVACTMCHEQEVFKNGKCRTCLKEYYYWANLTKKFGVTQELWQQMFDKQEGECAICGANNSELVPDHCHTTNIFRGLLCRVCNAAIGQLGDTASGVLRAYEYLKRAEANG